VQHVLLGFIVCLAIVPRGENTLNAAIERHIQASGAESVSVAFLDLESGDETLLMPDEAYHPASTMKVPVMMEVFRQARSGRFRMEMQIPVRNEFRSIADETKFSVGRGSDGDPGLHERIGRTESVRDLVRRMIVRSSNLATNLLVDLVGAESISDSMKKMGAPGMVVLRGVEDGKAFESGLNNSATARSLLVLMRAIASGNAYSRADSVEMERILIQQEFNEGIPAGVPRGVKVAHKTGWITGIYHDAAIVHPPNSKPYILVVMTRGIPDVKRAHRLVADISRTVFDSQGSRIRKTESGNWDP
jgi:beta-lactamase class A